MKKEYTTPEVEKVQFNYREQVVASSPCKDKFTGTGFGTCDKLEHEENLL